MSTVAIDYKDMIDEISNLVLKGIECWHQAGARLCELIDNDPDVFDKICCDVPQLTPNILRQLERIGRRQLVPELLLKAGAGWNRLRQMPFDVQKRFMEQPVSVLIETANGPDEIKVAIDDLTPRQAKQVFSDNGPRDLGSQRAWLRSHQPQLPEPKETRKPYSVHGRVLVVTTPCKLSLQEIGVILAEMKQ